MLVAPLSHSLHDRIQATYFDLTFRIRQQLVWLLKTLWSIYHVQHRADILPTPPSCATRVMTVGDTDNGILCAECQQKASIFSQVD
jgi:hypothetical protein